ncbi:hypothetical protein GALL_533980 [mine drainage metagenome]|uniref:Uncharacterized protein n=1 Tax=mine drainage metagenome TaxID=410659 RepID=A0A1J5PB67_9ZZZZ
MTKAPREYTAPIFSRKANSASSSPVMTQETVMSTTSTGGFAANWKS